MPLATQFGMKEETTYGTLVTPDRFLPVVPGNFPQIERELVEGDAVRTGAQVRATDQFGADTIGANETQEFEVASTGFGLLLKHCMGAVSTSAEGSDGEYEHTFTLGDTCDLSATTQSNIPFGACGDTNQGFTATGMKVSSFTLSMTTKGLLKLSVNWVGHDLVTSESLATASYPSGMELLTWARAAVTFAGSPVPVSEFSLTVDHKLDTDRHYLANDTNRSQPVTIDRKEVTFEATCDWDDLSHYNRSVASTAAGMVAAASFNVTGKTVIGGTTYPALGGSLPNVRFDPVEYSASGLGRVTQKIKGMGLTTAAGAEPLTLLYTTADATP